MDNILNVIIFWKLSEKSRVLLNNLLSLLVPHCQIEFYFDTEKFVERIAKPQENESLLILIAENNKNIESLLGVKKLIQKFDTILVLPDHNPETISNGHKLHPRFLTFIDDNFSELTKFLEHILRDIPPIR